MGKREISPESIKTGLPDFVGFLKCLEAGLPDSVDPHLLGLLAGALENPLKLAMLAKTIQAGEEILAQPARR